MSRESSLNPFRDLPYSDSETSQALEKAPVRRWARLLADRMMDRRTESGSALRDRLMEGIESNVVSAVRRMIVRDAAARVADKLGINPLGTADSFGVAGAPERAFREEGKGNP